MYKELALLNPRLEPALVAVDVFARGAVRSDSTTLDISPWTQIVELLEGDGFFGPGFSQVRGHFSIQSSVPIVTFALFGDYWRL